MHRWAKYFLLIFIFLFALGLRLYHLENVPFGTHADEASWGYNAYSILKTGKDEHGKKMPLVFKAFGDQKLPAYTYSIVPAVKTFGLNNFSVRFPAAAYGAFLVVAIFFLLKIIGFNDRLSLFGSLITAVSPWTLSLSRIFGYDSSLALLLYTVGICFFIAGTNKGKRIYLILSSIFFALTFYSYIAYRFITPVTIVLLMAIYFDKTKRLAKPLIIFLTVIVLMSLPIFYMTFKGTATARFNQASLNSSLGRVLEINESRSFCGTTLPKIICYMNANKAVSFVRSFSERTINLYSPDYLFFKGDFNSKFHNVDNFGLFYHFLFIFYLIGLFYLYQRTVEKKLGKVELLVIAGLIVAPLPAILVDDPQKIRISALFPYLLVLMLFGIKQIYEYIKSFVSEDKYISVLSLILLGSTAFLVVNFTSVHLKKYSNSFGSHTPKLMAYLKTQESNDIFMNKGSLAEGIIFYAFVNKVDPAYLQKNVIRQAPDAIGFVHATDLGNIHITDDDFYTLYCQNKNIKGKKVLYVTSQNLIKSGDVTRAEKVFFSDNGVDTLVSVYNIKNLVKKDYDCDKNAPLN